MIAVWEICFRRNVWIPITWRSTHIVFEIHFSQISLPDYRTNLTTKYIVYPLTGLVRFYVARYSDKCRQMRDFKYGHLSVPRINE